MITQNTRNMNNYVRKAAELISRSKHHNHTQFRHVSFVVQDDNIIAHGWNHRHDDPPPIYRDRGTIHAEWHAYRRAKELREYRYWYMVNVRLHIDYTVALAKPCIKCQKFLRAIGCGKVIYTTQDNEETIHL
jgi:tRNA(Arg) A34 adenosine deaminase TadA